MKSTTTPTSHPFAAMRRAGVPLVAYETAEPASSIREIMASFNGKAAETAFLVHDLLRGLRGLNDRGNEVAAQIGEPAMTGNPSEALRLLAESSAKRVCVFVFNAQNFIGNPDFAQGVWNLRDKFKSESSQLVLLCPKITLPPELQQDVVMLTEELPDAAKLQEIAATFTESEATPEAARKHIEANRERITDTLRGLSSFAAEQAIALNLNKEGMDLAGLWTSKRKQIEQTPGLQVWTGGETFAELGGLDNLKSFLTKVLTSGKNPCRAIGFIDEIEKGLAGSGGDTSGTSQDQLGVFLKVMQDLNVPGIILLGHPGTGKSAIAKAAGQVAGCPVVAIDTGAMKGSLVGQSEQRIRQAMDVFKSVSQGKGLFIATCNKIASLPPELRRRFTLGTFFVDLPSEAERKAIWPLWVKRYGLEAKQELPASDGWTGAEIRACCDVAFRTGMTLKEAAGFVVPVVKSAPDQVEALRKLAAGRFLSASAPGIYALPKSAEVSTGRTLDLGGSK